MYAKPPDAAELKAFGLTEADLETPPVVVFADNERAVKLFIRLGTQWRIGINGATGLDHNVLFKHIERMNLSDDEFDDLIEAVRALESAALEEIRKPS